MIANLVYHCHTLLQVTRKYQMHLRGEKVKLLFKKLSYTDVLHRYKKDQEWQRIYNEGKNIKQRYESREPMEKYVSRLTDLFKYAIAHQDEELSGTIINKIQKVSNIEKDKILSFSKTSLMQTGDVHYYTNKFYFSVFEYYSLKEKFSYCESQLVWGYLSAFNKSMFVYVVDVLNMTKFLYGLTKAHKYSLVEMFLDRVDWNFRYIMNMPKIHYVKGGMFNEREKVEKETLANWNDMGNYFFLYTSYCLAKKHYVVLQSLFRHVAWEVSVFPVTKQGIIYRYLRCMDKVHDVDQFEVWKAKDIYEDLKIDKTLLQNYCVFLLLLSNSEGYSPYVYFSQEELMTIMQEYKFLDKCAKNIQSDKELNNFFPKIAEQNFKDIFRILIEEVSLGRYVDWSNASILFKKDDFPSFMKWYLDTSLLRASISQTRERASDFIKNVPKSSTDYYEKILTYSKKQVLRQAVPYVKVPASRFAVDFFKTDIKPCQVLIDKRSFLYIDNYDLGYIHPITNIINSRINYVLLSAFKEMKIQDVKLKIADFHNFLIKITNGQFKDFIAIDINCHFQVFLKLKLHSNHRYSYYGMEYVEIESIDNHYLEDLPEFKEFQNTILILRKKDYPVLMNISDDVNVDFKDESSEQNGKLDIRVTFDFGLELWYRKNVNVVRVVPQRTLV